MSAYYLNSDAGLAAINTLNLRPGDQVLLQAGMTFHGNLSLGANDAGTAADPILISSFDPSTGQPLAPGAGTPAVINAGTGSGLVVQNAAGIDVTNLSFAGSGRTAGNIGDGIKFDNNQSGNGKLDSVTIDHVDVGGFGGWGITVGGSNGKSGFSNVNITYDSAHDNARGGIHTYGVFSATSTAYANSGVYIRYCTVQNNPGIPGANTHTGDGIEMSDVSHGTIELCVATNNGTLNSHNGGPVGIWAWDSDTVYIQYNESYANHTNSKSDGDGFDLDGGDTNCFLQYNYSHNNDGAGYGLFEFSGARKWNNNVVRFNISENDGRKNGYGGITIWNGGSGINNGQIHDNTIYMTPATTGTSRGIYVETTVNTVGIRNNIIQTTAGTLLVEIEGKQSSLSFQGNDYWASGAAFQIKQFAKHYSSLAAWRSGTKMELLNGAAVGFSVDPKFAAPSLVGTESAAAYVLANSSPLNNAGLNLSSLFGIDPGPQDFFGDQTAGVWNIGAD